MQKIGKVLWWDRRDREGIIVDGLGNQFYFNYSVLPDSMISRIRDGQLVEFVQSNSIPHVSCAKNISLVNARSRKRAEQSFYEQQQMQLGGI